MTDLSDNPIALKELMLWLLDNYEEVCRNRDTALTLLQELPNWRERYQELSRNQLLQEHTTERFLPLRKLITALLDGPVDDSLLEQLRAEVRKPRH